MADTIDCPTCKRPVLIAGPDCPSSFPFCSPRCRDRDLGAWFSGTYAVPGTDLTTLTEEDEAFRNRVDHERP